MKNIQKIIPFLTPSDELVTCEPWLLIEPREEVLPTLFPEWDSATDLRLKRCLKIDLSGIWQTCNLLPRDTLVLVTEWASDGTSLRGVSDKKILSHGQEPDLEIEIQIPGSELSQSLVLKTRLIFFPSEDGQRNKLSPHLPGSILWEDLYKVALEGEGSRFPMETINFERLNGVPLNANWHLSWLPYEPELQLSANVRLYLNSNSEDVIKALTESKPTEKHLAIRKIIFWDVGRRLVKGMLENKDFHGRDDSYPLGSLGLAVTSMLEIYFPNESIDGLRALLRSNPDLFETVLQSSFSPLHD